MCMYMLVVCIYVYTYAYISLYMYHVYIYNIICYPRLFHLILDHVKESYIIYGIPWNTTAALSQVTQAEGM